MQNAAINPFPAPLARVGNPHRVLNKFANCEFLFCDLESKEMEHRATYHLEGMKISAFQNIQVEGRHTDQSSRHTAEHRQSISPVRLEKLNASSDSTERAERITGGESSRLRLAARQRGRQ